MEKKIFPAFTTKVDADQGIVEAIVAVMGNVDQGLDVIWNGAFTKTITERGQKVKVLDQHMTDSINRVIGKPLAIREIPRGELPAALVDQYPEATGGLWTQTQYLIDTPEGKGAFVRIKEGAVDEYSIGYEAMDKDYSKRQLNGQEVTVRNLRTLKLYEYSPVLWAMNEATTTLSAKQNGDSSPENIMTPEDKAAHHVLVKAVNLSKHISTVVQAFYSQYPDVHHDASGTHVVYWVNQVWDEFVIVEQQGTAGNFLWQIPYTLADDLVNFSSPDEWVEVELTPTPKSSTPPPDDQAGDDQLPEAKAQAGPDTPPTSDEDMLRQIEIAEIEISLNEVEHALHNC